MQNSLPSFANKGRKSLITNHHNSSRFHIHYDFKLITCFCFKAFNIPMLPCYKNIHTNKLKLISMEWFHISLIGRLFNQRTNLKAFCFTFPYHFIFIYSYLYLSLKDNNLTCAKTLKHVV